MEIIKEVNSYKEVAVARDISSLDPEVRGTSLKVTGKIVGLFGDKVDKVILFGSRARGDFEEDSDYDFLVLGSFENASWPERIYCIRQHVGFTGYPVDFLALTIDEFETKLLIREQIKREGVVLYEGGC